MTIRNWNGSSWGAAQPITTNSATCGNAPCAAGTINTSPIPFADSDGLITSGQMASRTFGEAQIDLRLLFQPNKCASFGSAMLKSRSADTFTSALKDLVSPVPISLQNCGKVIIHKNTVPDETDQNFDYTKNFAQDTTPATATQLNFQLNDNDADGGANAVPDTRTFNGVLFGNNLTVTENALPATWKFDSLNCDASVGVPAAERVITDKTVTFKIDDAADVLECTYTNSQLTTTLGTAQSFIPQDTATVGGLPNSGFDGTVDFRLYSGLNCGGATPPAPLYEELNVPLTAAKTATTSNDGTPSSAGATDGYTIAGTGGDFSWKVKYEGDGAADGAQHPDKETCVEESRVTIDNDDTVAPNPLQGVTT